MVEEQEIRRNIVKKIIFDVVRAPLLSISNWFPPWHSVYKEDDHGLVDDIHGTDSGMMRWDGTGTKKYFV